MTRRPSVHRPSRSVAVLQHKDRAQPARQTRPKTVDGSESVHPTPGRLHQTYRGNESDEDSDGDLEDGGSNAPGIAQWIDDDELDLRGDEDDDDNATLVSERIDDDEGVNEPGYSRRLRSLEDGLSVLPLGVLRSAQRSLAQTHALSDSESDLEERSDDDFNSSEDDPLLAKLSGTTENLEQSSKPRTVITKRANKHAPVEITSKRPVTRRRIAIDDALPKPRDPRFMHAAGHYDPSKFKQRYDFLSQLRSDELRTLREHMKRAKKLLTNSPSHLRTEREGEVNRLEHAVKRAESAVNLDNRERIESKALQSAKQTEKEKRKQGKAGWWMKRSEKKALVAKARLDAIASVGGRRAVKKAVEKKQKKIHQKEKKSRPFPRSEGSDLSNSKRQHPAGSVDARKVKRRRVV